jgi:hypothetical protein
MVNTKSMAGWIGFAGIMMLVIGAVDMLQGLIAIIEDQYFVPTRAGMLVVDLTAWGWFLLFWGALLALVGLGLLGAQGWARWTGIVLVSLNILVQLGFAGDSAFPLWSLTAIILNITVLYALTARWTESVEDLAVTRE